MNSSPIITRFVRKNAALAALAALLISAHLALAQNVPFPPKIIVNGNVLTAITDSEGWYFSDHYILNLPGGVQGTGPATLKITGNNVSFSTDGVHMVPGELITEAYWVDDRLIPEHWEVDYWIEEGWSGGKWLADGDGNPLYDSDGNRIPDPSDPPQWHDAEHYQSDWREDYVVPAHWVPEVREADIPVTDHWDDSGTYGNFQFQMASDMPVLPADSTGNVWLGAPQFGIPTVLVLKESSPTKKMLFQFLGSDRAANYDYYLAPPREGVASPGYLWISKTYYAGYDPELGSFSGTNSFGYFRDTSSASVRLKPRNGNEDFLAFGAPYFGPPRIWSDGYCYRFLTYDITNGVDVYLDLEETSGAVVVGSGPVGGLVTGTYADNFFQTHPAGTVSVEDDGSAWPGGRTPIHGGPPAVRVIGSLWPYRGSTRSADYYGGTRPGQSLSIDSNGMVSYSDPSLNFLEVRGFYYGGVFQNLPVIMRGVATNGGIWSSGSPGQGLPAAITVNGQPWYYSSLASAQAGKPTYLGPQSGQSLTIDGSYAFVSDPATSTYNVRGNFVGGKFIFAKNEVSVNAANAAGVPIDAFDADNNIAGNLDVSGNSFTLGTWGVGTSVYNSFTLHSYTSYDPQIPPTLMFESVRPGADWVWATNGNTSGTASDERMRLTSQGRVVIGAPRTTAIAATIANLAPSVKLFVNGDAKFEGVIRTQKEAGDISMGGFQARP